MKPRHPWRVVYAESSHRAGSPACLETCGAGRTPDRVYHEAPGSYLIRAIPQLANVTEMHAFSSDLVDDIVDGTGRHVVCFGHDYDDYGSVSKADAELLVASVNLGIHHRRLEALVLRLLRRYHRECGMDIEPAMFLNTLGDELEITIEAIDQARGRRSSISRVR